MEAVGFIGLGRMGRPMASNLCRKGFRLVVYDINPHAVSELELLQASGASTAAEVARRSQIVVTMLPDPTVVNKVIDADDGVIANANPAAVIMDMSTVDPTTTEKLARKARARGFGFRCATIFSQSRRVSLTPKHLACLSALGLTSSALSTCFTGPRRLTANSRSHGLPRYWRTISSPASRSILPTKI
jgi:hypothetical protein